MIQKYMVLSDTAHEPNQELGEWVKVSDVKLLEDRAVLMQEICKWVAQYFCKGVDDKDRIEALHMMSFANFRLTKFDEDQKTK